MKRHTSQRSKRCVDEERLGFVEDALDGIVADGLIEEVPSPDGIRYRLTDAGQSLLDEWRDET